MLTAAHLSLVHAVRTPFGRLLVAAQGVAPMSVLLLSPDHASAVLARVIIGASVAELAPQVSQ